MKIKYLFLLGMALLIAGCSNQTDETLELEVSHKGVEIKINGNIEQQYLARVNDNGFCNGDEIGLYGVNYTSDNSVAGTLSDKGNQVNNIRYTYDEETMSWSSTTPAYYKDVNTHIDLYAYYPYSVPNSTSAYQFEVEKDQNNNDGYALSDFLWAKATKVVPSENKVRLPFTHRMSCANVILVEGTGFAGGEFDALEKSVLVTNTTHSATIDLATGEVTAIGQATTEGIVMMNSSDGFRAIVIPQTIKASTTLFAITVDGVSYRYKENTTFVYQPGKQTKFTLTVDRKETTGGYEFKLTSCEIVDWIADIETHGGEARQYYVVNQETPGTLGTLIKSNGKNPDKIKNLKICGNVDARDFFFMRDSMEILQAINMKECVIKGYDNKYAANEIPDGAFFENYDKSQESLVYFVFPEKVTRIGHSAFNNTLLSGALIIPDDVTEIGNLAFSRTSITSLSLPHNLKKIGSEAFNMCYTLTGNLSLPETLEEMGINCFYDCGFVGSLTIPTSLAKIPEYCFADCHFSGDLIIPANIKEIGANAFMNCTNLTGQLILSDGLSTIRYGTFQNCRFQGELKLPNQIKDIEDWAFCGCNFTNIIFPEELVRIGNYTFADNHRLHEAITLPETLISIGEAAFASCYTLSGIVLPTNLAIIQNIAFNECYGLTSITCNAALPPTIIGDAFSGVAKNNFTVEVPEASVVKYQTANGWNEFQSIAAHHDFSISRRMLRTLNASHSQTYVLRAPTSLNWSIESKPDWVNITPSSGTGKANVTITVNEQVKGNGDRTGQIVFLLDDKDYRTTMTIEQYDYEYGDGDVIINQPASKGNGVNLVFMGDCFDAYDISKGNYLNGINEAIGHFFAIEPYNSYKEYFNIYTIVGMSSDSGMGTVNTIKDAKFGSQYSLEGITPNTEVIYEYACKAPAVTTENLNRTLIVMVENTQDYGGICYMWNDGSAIAICPMSADAYPYDFRGIVQHEAGGHGFGKLGDEYIYHNTFIQTCKCNCCSHTDEFNAAKANGWYDNMSLSGDMNEVPWSHLIYHPQYSNIVDMYEGGFYHNRGVYRSEGTSCMNNNIPYFSAISRQSIVERIMDYAGITFSIDDFYANDVLDASLASRSTQTPWLNTVGASKQHAPKLMGDKPKLNK